MLGSRGLFPCLHIWQPMIDTVLSRYITSALWMDRFTSIDSHIRIIMVRMWDKQSRLSPIVCATAVAAKQPTCVPWLQMHMANIWFWPSGLQKERKRRKKRRSGGWRSKQCWKNAQNMNAGIDWAFISLYSLDFEMLGEFQLLGTTTKRPWPEKRKGVRGFKNIC